MESDDTGSVTRYGVTNLEHTLMAWPRHLALNVSEGMERKNLHPKVGQASESKPLSKIGKHIYEI